MYVRAPPPCRPASTTHLWKTFARQHIQRTWTQLGRCTTLRSAADESKNQVRATDSGGPVIKGEAMRASIALRFTGWALLLVGVALWAAPAEIAMALGTPGPMPANGASDPGAMVFWRQLTFIRMFSTAAFAVGAIWCLVPEPFDAATADVVPQSARRRVCVDVPDGPGAADGYLGRANRLGACRHAWRYCARVPRGPSGQRSGPASGDAAARASGAHLCRIHGSGRDCGPRHRKSGTTSAPRCSGVSGAL